MPLQRFGDDALRIYAIYFSPLDYPDRYVVRLFENDRPTAWVRDAATLEEVRRFVPGDRVLISRHPADEPQIVECWI